MKAKTLVTLGIALSMILTGCGVAKTDAGESANDTQAQPESTETIPTETIPTDESLAEDSADDIPIEKQVVVYFPNWNLGSKAADAGGEVASIPWEDVTYINHAFWAVAPADGTTETSVERRNSGEGARTNFTIVSTSPENDYLDTSKSEINPSVERNHFAQYAAYSKKFPNVNIMISIGGWTDSGYFSEMAYTSEGRKSFIQSCLNLMDEYPWIDGIDIDWEYPGGSMGGERAPESADDQGCPIFGTAAEDNSNFTALLSELRSAMDEHYGIGSKKLTACASASTGWTLPMQDWASFAPHLDMINIMTYDLSGVWDGVTGEASSVSGAKSAVAHFQRLGIGTEKLCIGSPLYGTSYLLKEITPDRILGAPCENYKPDSAEINETMLQSFVTEAVSGYTLVQEGGKWKIGETFDNGGSGWHLAYNEVNGSAYMYNDDQTSQYYKWYISYENEYSLQEKLDYISETDLAGIIVWETSQDTKEHKFISQMADNLLK